MKNNEEGKVWQPVDGRLLAGQRMCIENVLWRSIMMRVIGYKVPETIRPNDPVFKVGWTALFFGE